MALLQDIQKRIRAKEAEIVEIEEQISKLVILKEAARAYALGLQEILPRVQRDEVANGAGDGKPVEFRKGSAPAIVREMLEKSGSPMHANQILEKMGKSGDKKAKLALVGTLARYARQGVGFKKTAPNTYALIGSDIPAVEVTAEETAEETSDDLPESFGR